MGEKIENAPLELGNEPVGRLLRKYAMPSILAMTAASLYNIVDSIFIGHGVGPLALSGLTVTFPFSNLSAAFGAMVGVGCSTMISMLLGQKDYHSAKKILGNALWLNTAIGLIFMTISLIFLDPILIFFGASAQSLPYARDYMQILLIGNIVTHMYLGQNTILRAAGHPKKALWLTLNTVVLNAVMDPIFIFTFGMGIRGAAVATVLAQVASLAIQFKLLNNRDEVIHYEKALMKLELPLIRKSLAIGLSPFFMNAAMCLVTLILNQQFQKYGGDMAVGAYGIVNRYSFLFFMVAMGVNMGVQPIAGYNFGAKRMDRVMQLFYLAVKVDTILLTTCFFFAEVCPTLIANIFTSDAELIALAKSGMRIHAIIFPILAFQVVTSQIFQSLGLVKEAVFLSLSRQLIFLVPAILIFPLFMGINGIWWSMPFSDSVTALTAWLLFRKFKKKYNI